MELIQFSTEMWTSVKVKGTKMFLLRYETRFYYVRLSDGDRKCSARRIVEGEKVSRGGGNLGTCLAIRSHPLCMHTITTSTDTLAWRQGGTTARSGKRAIYVTNILSKECF
jgi:hypothetical protein